MAVKNKFIDRKPLIIFLGVVEIFAGAAFLLIAVGLTAFAVYSPESYVKGLFSVIGFLYLLSVFICVLGIGMVRVRKWAQRVNLAFSWTNLVVCVISSVILLLIFIFYTVGDKKIGRELYADLPSLIIPMIFMIFLMLFIVAVPLICAVLLQSDDIVKTFNKYDIKQYVFLNNPMKIFSIEFLLTLLLPYYLFMAIEGGATPFFGMMIDGWRSRLFSVIVFVLVAATVYYLHKLSRKGWNLLILSIIVMFVPVIFTYALGDPAAVLSQGNAESAKALTGEMSKNIMKILFYSTSAGVILCLGYMFFVKKYFNK